MSNLIKYNTKNFNCIFCYFLDAFCIYFNGNITTDSFEQLKSRDILPESEHTVNRFFHIIAGLLGDAQPLPVFSTVLQAETAAFLYTETLSPSQIKEIILIAKCVFYFCDYDFESFLTLENMWSQEVSAYAYFTVYPALPKSVWKLYHLIYDPQPPEIRRSPKAPPSGELSPPQGGD